MLLICVPCPQERPTMILYGIDNIRDLFGHKVNLSMIKKNPICRLGL
jgi:phenylalanyl-tRNA synthetase alpha chain